MMKKAIQIRDEVQPLGLKLPKVFDIKPAHEIDLPNSCKALVYDTKVSSDDWVGDKRIRKEKPGWRVVIVNKHGRTPRVLSSSRYEGDTSLTDPLDVRRYVEKVAWMLSKVKTTTVSETDADE